MNLCVWNYTINNLILKKIGWLKTEPKYFKNFRMCTINKNKFIASDYDVVLYIYNHYNLLRYISHNKFLNHTIINKK